MASSVCSASTATPVRSHISSRAVLRPGPTPQGLASFNNPARRSSLRSSTQQRSQRTPRSRTVVKASAVEVFQLADEGALIGGTAAVLFAITLVGLAVGFVLLRVEALVEEGKI